MSHRFVCSNASKLTHLYINVIVLIVKDRILDSLVKERIEIVTLGKNKYQVQIAASRLILELNATKKVGKYGKKKLNHRYTVYTMCIIP